MAAQCSPLSRRYDQLHEGDRHRDVRATPRMIVGRRKTMPQPLRPAWEAFQTQAERVEAARQALLGCLPVGRIDPAPVPVGLDLLRDELAAVTIELHSWRTPAMEDTWQRCRVAVEESLAGIPEARAVAATTGELEEMLDVVAGVVEPLDAWHDAERAWLRLRRRQRP